MKLVQFDPPANIADFTFSPALRAAWSAQVSLYFDTAVLSVSTYLASAAGTCQFYNPVLAGRTDPDLPLTGTEITWNGFPRRFLATAPGEVHRYAEAEPDPPPSGEVRPQDEYLEWHVVRNPAGKIVSVHFTCEGLDYYQYLGERAPAIPLALFRRFVHPGVATHDLYIDGIYNILNPWNTERGAMHLTNPANSLFGEVFLAAAATVRRRDERGEEITGGVPLTSCALFGSYKRNSDPNIGATINTLARQGRMITLANPVGVYMVAFDGAGFRLPDGSSAGRFFRILRGSPGQALRAAYELPPELATTGLTVSDVTVGGAPIEFGGQIAQRITMKLDAVASVARLARNLPMRCGKVPRLDPPLSRTP
jgi:hypothetical protein